MISDRQLLRVLRSEPLVQLTGDLIRALVGASMIVVSWIFAVFYAVLGRKMFGDLHMNDFGRFYYSGRAFLEGADMYGPTPATGMLVGAERFHLWNMNPPHFHLFIVPLAFLPPAGALLAWTIASVAALVASLHIIVREMHWRWSWTAGLWTAFAIFISSAMGIAVVTGQLSLLLTLPMTLAWRAARQDRWIRAAVYLGVLVSLKPFLAIFGAYLLVSRRWRATCVMAAAAAGCVAAGVAVFGWPSYMSWLGVLKKVDWSFAAMNASVPGLLARSFAENPVFVPVARLPSLVPPLAAVAAAGLGIGALAVFGRDKSGQATDRAFGGLLLTALLVSPLGWMYYIWLAIGPATALWTTLAARPSYGRDICVVAATPGLLLPIYMVTLWADHPWGSLTAGSLYSWTVLALWTAFMFDAAAADRVDGAA